MTTETADGLRSEDLGAKTLPEAQRIAKDRQVLFYVNGKTYQHFEAA